MDLGAPELVPRVLEYGHRGDAALLDLSDQFRPNVVVKMFVFGEFAGLQAHRESATYHGNSFLVSRCDGVRADGAHCYAACGISPVLTACSKAGPSISPPLISP